MNIKKLARNVGVLIVTLIAAYLGIPLDSLQNGGGNANNTANTSSSRPASQAPRVETPAPAIGKSEPARQSATKATVQTAPLEKGWSRSNPNINLTHIFFGEVNRSGEPTGYHSRPGGNDPEGARVKRISSGPNRAGVYTAEVEIWDRSDRQWKQKFSSFFPDSMSQQQIIAAVLSAYNKRDQRKDAPWEGPSGHGFNIQGYESSRGGINTAFPVYRRD